MMQQRASKKVLRPVDRNVQDVIHTSNPKMKRPKSRTVSGEEQDSNRFMKTDRSHRQIKAKRTEVPSEAEFDCSPAARCDHGASRTHMSSIQTSPVLPTAFNKSFADKENEDIDPELKLKVILNQIELKHSEILALKQKMLSKIRMKEDEILILENEASILRSQSKVSKKMKPRKQQSAPQTTKHHYRSLAHTTDRY